MKNLKTEQDLDLILSNIRKSVQQNKEHKKKDDEEDFEYPDYYKIIGVSVGDSQEVINKKCNQKMSEYHHDKINIKLNKYPIEERKKQKEKYLLQFKLIRDAREVLINPEKKKMYDIQRKNTNNSFECEKKKFDQYMKLQEAEMTDENKELAKLKWKEKSLEINKKHGYVNNENYVDKKEFDKRLGDIQTQRSQQDADCSHKKIFDNRHFDQTEFNKQFEIMKKKKEKHKKQKENDKSIIEWTGVSAYGDFGNNGGDYADIKDYEELYKLEKTEDFKYSCVIGSDSEKSLSSIDTDTEDEIDVSYVENHNKNKKQLDATFAKMVEKRELENAEFEKKQIVSEDVSNNPFNISYHVGIVGENFVDKDIKIKNKKELMEAYKALMYEKKND